MKLTLIGYGFVGKAMHHVLHKWHDVKIVDPQYNDCLLYTSPSPRDED